MNPTLASSLALVLALSATSSTLAQADVDAIINSDIATSGNRGAVTGGGIRIDPSLGFEPNLAFDSNTGGAGQASQQTSLRAAFGDAAPVGDVDFDLSVGSTVPSRVALLPVPGRVLDLNPSYAGYGFFWLADGRLVLVEPQTRRIALILS